MLFSFYSCDNFHVYRIKYKVYIEKEKYGKDTTVVIFTTHKGCEKVLIDRPYWDTIIGPVSKNFPTYLSAECISKREPEIHICIQVEENMGKFLPKRWKGNNGYVRTLYYTGRNLKNNFIK